MINSRILCAAFLFISFILNGSVHAESISASLFGAIPKKIMNKPGGASLADGRICMKSFPFPPGISFTPNGGQLGLTGSQLSKVREDVELAIETSGSGIQIPTDAIARINKERNLDKLSTLDQAYYQLYVKKVNAEQLRAYAHFLELLKLSQEGHYQQVIESVKRLQKTIGWKIRADPFAEAHTTKDGEKLSTEKDATFYSTQQLRNAIYLLKVVSLVKTRSHNRQTALSQFIAFEENRGTFEPFFDIAGDPRSEMLAKLSWLSEVGKGEPFWMQRESVAFYNGLRGIRRDPNETIAYVGTTKVIAISLKHGFLPRLVSAEAASNFYDSYLSTQTRKLSNESLSVKSVLFNSNQYEVRSGEMVAIISEVDRTSLLDGKQLVPDHSFTKLVDGLRGKSIVFYSHPLMQVDGEQLDRTKKLVHAMRSAYPEKQIFLDPFSPKTYSHVKKINAFQPNAPKKILAIIPSNDTDVTDYKIIQNIGSKLAEDGIEVVKFDAANPKKYKGAGNRSVIVITGHSDKALSNWVRHLGQAGYFKNNIVVFNSCETPLNNQLIAELTTRYSAVGTYVFEGKISAAAVEEFMAELSTLYKKATTAGKKSTETLTSMLTRVGTELKLRAFWVVSMDTAAVKLSEG